MKKEAFRLVFVTIVCLLGQRSYGITISGQVVDTQARPVEGAEVVVYEREYLEGDYGVRATSPIVPTDADGRFELDFDCQRQYDTFIVTRKPGYAMAWDGLNYSSHDRAKGEFLLVLEPPCTQTGRILDAQGQPAVGADVQLVPKTSYMDRLSQRPMFGPKEWFSCKTDEQGVFSFAQLGPDVCSDFRVTLPNSSFTQTFTTHYLNCCGYEVDLPDLELHLPPLLPVRGWIVDEGGHSISRTAVQIRYDSSREDITHRYLSIQTSTDAEGQFCFPGIPTGQHRISLFCPQDRTADWVAEPVILTIEDRDHEVTPITLKATRGAFVDLVVRDAQDGMPLKNMKVYAAEIRRTRTTDSQGKVRLRVLPGQHSIRGWGKGYDQGRLNEPLEVKAGDTVKRDLLLDREQGGFITGQVLDERGYPASQAEIKIYPFGEMVLTDEQGAFNCAYDKDRAENGLYIVARDTEHGLAAIEKISSLDDPVTLPLAPGLIIQGTIEDPNGQPIPAARISFAFLYSNCLDEIGSESLTNTQGTFFVRAMPELKTNYEYRISVHVSGYAPRTYDRIAIEDTASGVSQIDTLVLQPANQTINGTILDANGIPAPSVAMFLNGDGGIVQPDKTTATDEEGHFQFTRLAKGKLRIQLNFDDSSVGHGWLYCHAGDHGIKAFLGRENVHEPFKVLQDNRLPDPRNLSPDLAQVLYPNQPALLCFVDIELRTARHCLSQLAGQLEPLKEQGLQVLIVQMVPVNLSSYQDWLDKKGINLPIYPVEGDLVQKKFDWGIKSLPWLILTDKEHKVVGEGLSIDEILERL